MKLTPEWSADLLKDLRSCIRHAAYDALLDRYPRPKADRLANMVANSAGSAVLKLLQEQEQEND